MVLFGLALIVGVLGTAGAQLLSGSVLVAQLNRGLSMWWLSQLLVPLAQVGSLAILSRFPLARSRTALWTAWLGWWFWPWQNQPQLLRVELPEVAWHLCLLLGLWISVPIRLRLAFLALAGWFLPASLPGLAAALAWTSVGTLRALAVLLAYVGAITFFRGANPWELGLALSSLVILFLRRGEVQVTALLVYAGVTGLLGGPSTAAVPAIALATLVDLARARSLRLGRVAGLLAGLAVLSWGSSQVERKLLAPWRRYAPLSQLALPHAPEWWASRFGVLHDFRSEDLQAARWLSGQTAGEGLVVTPGQSWEAGLTATLYRHFSAGRAGAGWLEGHFTLEALWIKKTLRPEGSGLRYLVMRGRPERASELGSPVFQAGEVRVYRLEEPDLPPLPVYDLSIVDRGGPGGVLQVNLWADGPVTATGPVPRLVLWPGMNALPQPTRQPVRVFDFGGKLLSLPALDLAAQAAHLRVVGPAAIKVAAAQTSEVKVRLRNGSNLPLELGSLPGLRLAFPGETPQPVQFWAGSLPPNAETEVVLQITTDAWEGWQEAHLRLVDPAGVEYLIGTLNLFVVR